MLLLTDCNSFFAAGNVAVSVFSCPQEGQGQSSASSSAWASPGQLRPFFDSRYLFFLPVSPANSLPWTHPGLLCHRLVSLPAACMLPALPKLFAGLQLSCSPAPTRPHCPSIKQTPVIHVPWHLREPLSPALPELGTCITALVCPRPDCASPPCPGSDTFPSWVKPQEVAYS